MRPKLRLGTRGSALALAQARLTASALAAASGWTPEEAEARIEIVVIKTTGDRVTDRSLADIGGKGLFAKELEEALAQRRVDLAVHSAKDLPSILPPGMCLAAALPREDPRDALICTVAASVAALPQGAIVGTSSVRRQAQLLRQRPDLKIVLYRGNVDTRIAKLRQGEVDATILALAGLKRLGREQEAAAILSPQEMLPAAGQGVIALECRDDDTDARILAARIGHASSFLALSAERAFLATLDGSCKTPLAALAEPGADAGLHFRGLALSPDGSRAFSVERRSAHQGESAAAMGEDAAREILSRAGRSFLAQG
jgi:hydroxymethylbilane synthase